MRKAARIIGVLALLLILASFPTCYVGERLVRPELSKLSPEELKARQFDIEYLVYVLPGIFMFFVGCALAVAAGALGLANYLARRQEKRGGKSCLNRSASS